MICETGHMRKLDELGRIVDSHRSAPGYVVWMKETASLFLWMKHLTR